MSPPSRQQLAFSAGGDPPKSRPAVQCTRTTSCHWKRRGDPLPTTARSPSRRGPSAHRRANTRDACSFLNGSTSENKAEQNKTCRYHPSLRQSLRGPRAGPPRQASATRSARPRAESRARDTPGRVGAEAPPGPPSHSPPGGALVPRPRFRARPCAPPVAGAEIGRASCRERVSSPV